MNIHERVAGIVAEICTAHTNKIMPVLTGDEVDLLASFVRDAIKDATHRPPVRELELFVRVPGLFRGWEIEQVLEPGHEFHIVTHGECPPDSTPLYAVNRRRLLPDERTQACAEAHRP